ncbi:TetR/AcrR family transcriptional regulator [Roseibacterium sp. SDUM158017]|uniref:TetR/AcrR family transcriptional regulator n=1 Tax=Roseicyclus salinarum TaxID=3036773 RepID=UPI002414E5BD|nr:TetR/AcrR family transcriptional regulator [Roseibacterium sp. SDUM158017]MDG4648544.1 TetR/AcrR family transcriptional regulator [Roseibacterium sp. SDUM158017]
MSRKTDETRERILRATLDLLASGSPERTRMSDIARASGLSRQALYLHFPNRADLLVAATRHLDDEARIDASLAESRAAATGEVRLAAFIRAWGGHIPVIYPVGRALMAMQDSDAEARAAWSGRMEAVRQGCAAAVAALERDGALRADLTRETATDLLAGLLSVPVWAHLTRGCGWTQEAYLAETLRLSRCALMANP